MINIQKILFCTYFLGCYIDYSLVLPSNFIIPYFFSHISCILLLIINFQSLLLKRKFYFLISIFSFIIISLILSPKLYHGVLYEQLTTSINFLVSFLSFLGIWFASTNISKDFILNVTSFFLFFLIAGSMSERLIPQIKDLSDFFRSQIYNFGIYDSLNRDINLVAFERPKLFSREPSYLARFIIFSTAIWYSLTNNNYKFLFFFLIAVLGTIFVGSPMILILFPLVYLRKAIVGYNSFPF